MKRKCEQKRQMRDGTVSVSGKESACGREIRETEHYPVMKEREAAEKSSAFTLR
jgi:hypothetical protein